MDTQYFDFGRALRYLRVNARVARKGWNGKGMFLVLVPGSEGLTVDEGRPLAKAGVPVGTKFNYLPHIDMRTAQGDFVPWLASQTDMLAQDWFVTGVDDLSSSAEASWSIYADSLHAGEVVIHSGDKVTDGTRTETIKAMVYGPGLDSPAIFLDSHPDGISAAILSLDQFVDGNWRVVDGGLTASINPRDIVRLKSGGPDMIVEGISGNHVLCSWDNGTVRDRAYFPCDALNLVQQT